MKKLCMVCNGHLDPVWLWGWEEGAAAAIATFRAAADFCEEYDGFVFCHNEALLYQWTEKYDPTLFERIQKLVRLGKWNIMGGWFLQPDCNLPSGESLLRQILTGRDYFKEKFQVQPEVAVNFDTFGHSRGLVQILRQCGYRGYVFMRPEKERMELPSRNFVWKGFDGSEILAHRLDRPYNSHMGEVLRDVKNWVLSENEESISLFTWGVGNHGGGPSRIDLDDLAEWMQTQTELQVVHTTPDMFFEALMDEENTYSIIEEDLRPVFVGCYTSQLDLKQMHRQLENLLYSTEKLLAVASSLGLLAYPTKELEEVQYDLLFSEFHDILPGTTIASGAEAACMIISHGLELASRLRMQGFMAMLTGQKAAEPEEIPIFIFNPHPYPVSGVFSCEFMPMDQNWSREIHNCVTVRQQGLVIPSQEEKAELNMNLDWRKRIAFQATLAPASMNRFDCLLHQEPCKQAKSQTDIESDICFENDSMKVRINRKSGLMDSYCVNGVEYINPGAFAAVVFQDTPDPWYMQSHSFTKEIGRFAPTETVLRTGYLDGEPINVPAVRVVEDGPVRMVIEAEFVWRNSRVVQTYILPRFGSAFELELHVFWSEDDTMLKLEIPTSICGTYLGQGVFGYGALPQDGTEAVSQQWCGLFGKENALTVCNTGTYGSHCVNRTIYLSLLRSPAYAAHPIEDRRLVHEDRFIPRMDKGNHTLRFAICGSGADERKDNINREAQIFNESPYALNAFPSGQGSYIKPFIQLSDNRVLISAMYCERKTGSPIVRLWNSTEQSVFVKLDLPHWNLSQQIEIEGFSFKTFKINPKDGVNEISVME